MIPRAHMGRRLAPLLLCLALFVPSARAERVVYPARNEQCGAFCAGVVMRYFDLHVPIGRVTERLPADPLDEIEGVSLLQLRDTLRDEGLFAAGVTGLSISRLAEVVGRDLLAVLHVTVRGRSHFWVFAGARDGETLLADTFGARWVPDESPLVRGFAGEGEGGKCLLVSDDLRALQDAIKALGMAVPPELQKGAAISFGKTSAGFSPGDVVDGKVRFTFPFENTGDALLVIRGIRHSCGCISVEKPKKRLNPAEMSELIITVDCDSWGNGLREKAVHVHTNAPDAPWVRLAIKGTCRTKGASQSVEALKHYPHEIFIGSLASPSDWNAADHPITISTALESGVTVTSASCDLPGGEVTLGPAETRKGRRLWKLYLRLADLPTGRFEGEVSVQLTGHDPDRFVIPVRGDILPVLPASPPELTFFIDDASDTVERAVRVYSPLGRNVQVDKMETVYAGGKVKVTAVVDEGADTIRVRVTGQADAGTFRGHLMVHTNLEYRGTLSIPFTCYITGPNFQ